MTKIKLSTKRLTPGLYIKLDCPWNSHPFLSGSFQIQNQLQIDALQSLTIKYVFFFPEKSNATPLPPNFNQEEDKNDNDSEIDKIKALWSEKTQRIEEQKRYSRNLKKYKNYCEQSLSVVRAIHLKMANQGQQALTDATELIVSINEILDSNKSIILQLMEKGEKGDEYYNHVFHVTILSLILGKSLALSAPQLIQLGLGALFHDLGLSKIPSKIVNNNPKITQAEKNYLKLHVRYAIAMINDIPNIPVAVTEIVSQHHEYLDGSGYPQRLKGKEINFLSQIVSVADEFDTLCNPADKYVNRPPYQALAYLYKNRSEQLNKKVIGLLIKELGVYPPGSVVLLSNEKYALVINPAEGNILQPDVLIYDPSIPKNEAPIISLSKEKLKIEKVILATKLPEKIQEYLNLNSSVSYYFENNGGG